MAAMAPALAFLAATLALAQQTEGRVTTCFGTSVAVHGLDTAMLDDAAVAELRRFARSQALTDYRLRLVVFAHYGFNRGTTVNQQVTTERGEVIRAHLIAEGLQGDRIRVLRLGEHANYPFPTAAIEAQTAIMRREGERWTRAGLIIIEAPAGSDCRRFLRP